MPNKQISIGNQAEWDLRMNMDLTVEWTLSSSPSFSKKTILVRLLRPDSRPPAANGDGGRLQETAVSLMEIMGGWLRTGSGAGTFGTNIKTKHMN